MQSQYFPFWFDDLRTSVIREMEFSIMGIHFSMFWFWQHSDVWNL